MSIKKNSKKNAKVSKIPVLTLKPESKKGEVEKCLIEIALKIAREGKGCLFVMKEKNLDYDFLLPQDIKPFPVLDNRRRLEALAIIDGACIIDSHGNLIAYGVKINHTKSYKGYGTRHSAAYTASFGNISIMASEEDRKVRIFKEGDLMAQMDALERNIDTKASDTASLLESIGVGSLVTIGSSMILPPSAGIAIAPGVIFFGSTAAHYLIQHFKSNNFFQNLLPAYLSNTFGKLGISNHR
jgi:hypothetical protein